MRKAQKLSRSEQLEIEILLGKGYKQVEIAGVLGRSKSTISDEVRRNSVQGVYSGKKAQHKAYVRRKYARFQWKKINENRELKEYIITGLQKHWNPKEIAGRMKKEKQPFYASKTAIYEWLYSTQGVRYCKHLYSKRCAVKKRIKKTKRVMIPNRVGIEHRPLGATNRSRYGHFECDTIVSGKNGSGAISVLIDRKSRYVILNKLDTLSPKEHVEVLTRAFQTLYARSVTFDNGMENRSHEQLDLASFFCDSYASWQKGTVENVNKMIRRYIPKGSNIAHISQQQLDMIADIINKKPRALLGFQSAYAMMINNNLFSSSRSVSGLNLGANSE